MASRGFTFYVTWAPTTADNVTPEWWEYVSADLDQARQHGYRLPQSGIDRATEPNIQYVRGLTEQRRAEYERAYSGDRRDAITVDVPLGSLSVNRTGCLSEARTWLYGDLRQWLLTTMTISGLDPEVHRAVTADPRYQAALGRWRECLIGRGYDFADPMATRKAGLDFGPAERQKEIRLAVADAECTVSSRLVDTIAAVHEEQLARIRDAHRADIAAYEDLRNKAVIRARDVLAAARATAISPTTEGDK